MRNQTTELEVIEETINRKRFEYRKKQNREPRYLILSYQARLKLYTGSHTSFPKSYLGLDICSIDREGKFVDVAG